MSLCAPKTIYGVHSLSLYNRETWEPYGIIKVLGSLAFNLTGDFNDLYGGSSLYAWESEQGVLSAELSGTIKEIPNFAFEKFLGASVTANSAETSGNVGTLTDKYGTVVNATTGVASAGAKSGSEADLKDGLYLVKVVSATTVDVYAMSDYDFDKGTDKSFETDLLKITATPLTVPDSGAAVEVPGYGFELIGGSGTVDLETAGAIGDTAYVYVRKVNSGSDLITNGQSTAVFPAFGAMVASQKKGNGNTFETQLFNCKAIGLPISHTEAEWMNSDITLRAIYDSTENAVAKFRRVQG